MIRFATIGSGHIVEQFLTEAQKHPEFTLTAVYSRTGERAAEFAAQWGAPLTFTDLSSLAACPEVDAVYIASPNLCHAEQAITLMKAGKHILCEKPMATTYIDCDGMVLQAHNSHVILLEAMRTLFAPGFARLHQLIPEIGTLRRICLEDAVKADEIFTILMGEQVEPRKAFIEENAKYAVNLDF